MADDTGNGTAVPDLGTFDEQKAVRRARREMIAKTVLIGLLVVFVGSLPLSMLSAAIAGRGDRDERFAAIAAGALAIAHPGYEMEGGGCCNHGLLLDTWTPWRFRPRGVSPAAEIELEIKQGVLGRIGTTPGHLEFPSTAVDRALGSAPSKAETRSLLERLPADMKATVVVELAAPMTQQAFDQLAERHHAPMFDRFVPHLSVSSPWGAVPIIVEPLALPTGGPPRHGTYPVVWPSARLDLFTAWTRMLRDSDNENLFRLDVPDATVLRALGRDPKIHGFVLDEIDLAQVSGLLADPAIRGVSLGGVEFDLQPG